MDDKEQETCDASCKELLMNDLLTFLAEAEEAQSKQSEPGQEQEQ